jgi:hypothetical protein
MATVVVFTPLHLLHNLMNGPNKLVLHYTGLERLARDKQSSLLGRFVSYEENEVLSIWHCVVFTPLHLLHNLRMGPIG